MKRAVLLPVVCALLSFPLPSHAQFGKALDQVFSGGKSKSKKEKGNKTEELILGGLKTLKALAPIGYEEELAIGGAVALEAVARFGGLWENSSVETYVAKVGNAVALTSDRPTIPYYFGILNTNEPNAFAAPGGYIFISRGLLKKVGNEAQLAGILGHEIAHVAKKHALEAIRRSKALAGVSEVTLTAMDKDPAMFDAVVKQTVNLLFEQGVGREKELESDSVGTDYAMRVGYAPQGLRDFLKILSSIKMAKENALHRTHPSAGDRVAQLDKILAKSAYRETASLPTLAERFASAFSGATL